MNWLRPKVRWKVADQDPSCRAVMPSSWASGTLKIDATVRKAWLTAKPLARMNIMASGLSEYQRFGADASGRRSIRTLLHA